MDKPPTPQDKAINHSIPLYFYTIHEWEGKIYGSLIDWKPAWETQKDYVVVFKFNGKEAHYWIGTNDRSILRKDALSFAVAVHEHRIRVFHCDLSKVSGKRKANKNG